MPSKGFIYVASKDKIYYELAIWSAISLREMYPEADITLFTHRSFVDDRASIFNSVVTGIPIHTRAKMWCMARTPYDLTFYNDVDSQIIHPNIRKVFDELEDCDMFFTESFWYTTANYKWAFIDKDKKIPVLYHGAVCAYKKSDLTIDFHQTWFKEYVKQRTRPWSFDFAYKEWQQFDMFTLWRLTSGKFPEFQRFTEGLRVKKGPKVYNATIHDKGTKEEYDGLPAVNMQIDKQTVRTMKIWEKMEKRVLDERSLPKRPEIRQDLMEYD